MMIGGEGVQEPVTTLVFSLVNCSSEWSVWVARSHPRSYKPRLFWRRSTHASSTASLIGDTLTIIIIRPSHSLEARIRVSVISCRYSTSSLRSLRKSRFAATYHAFLATGPGSSSNLNHQINHEFSFRPRIWVTYTVHNRDWLCL